MDLFNTITKRISKDDSPTLILMPYGFTDLNQFEKNNLENLENFDINKPDILVRGNDGIILSVGNKINTFESN